MSLPAALPGRRERQTDSTRARLFEAAIAEFRPVGLRAGLEAEAAARVCLTSPFGLPVGLPAAPAQRRADLALLFSLYLADGAP